MLPSHLAAQIRHMKVRRAPGPPARQPGAHLADLAAVALSLSLAFPTLAYTDLWAQPNVATYGRRTLALPLTMHTRGGDCDWPGCDLMARNARSYYCQGHLAEATKQRSSRAARAQRAKGRLSLPLPSGNRAIVKRVRLPAADITGQPSGYLYSVPVDHKWIHLDGMHPAVNGVIRTKTEKRSEENVRDDIGLNVDEWMKKNGYEWE
jgi:hypothetical protein